MPVHYQQLIDGRLDVGIGRAALAPLKVASPLFRQYPLGSWRQQVTDSPGSGPSGRVCGTPSG